jgi:hypothetical protein
VSPVEKDVAYSDENYLELNVRLASMETVYDRKEYSFVTWFALLGGVTKVFVSYFRKMTTAVSKKLFENAILSDLFFVKRRNSEDTEFTNKGAGKGGDDDNDLIRVPTVE